MADFFENFGKKVSEAASDLGKKTQDAIEIQKIKSEIRSLKRNNERDFTDIGKAVYEMFQNNEVLDMGLVAFCEAIEKREEEITIKEEEIAKIK